MNRFRSLLAGLLLASLTAGCGPTGAGGTDGTSVADESAAADATVTLGAEQRVKELYSYPNNCNTVVCYQDETLAQTVKRWFDASLRRDGFDGATAIREENGVYYVDITLSPDSPQRDLEVFTRRYEEFLRHGDTAVQLARNFNEEGRWLANWRFILPHGLAMTHNRSLEVMNFPPVSLILETQDYLNSATTHRWMKMLEENGVKPEDKDLYGAILDIVPVAAPANEGDKLNEAQIYDGSFNDYAMPMLAMWTEVEGTNQSKPIMTLGLEMKSWFDDNFGTDFENILDVALVKVTDDRQAPIMYTNHPSKIFYNPKYEDAIKIMDQDVVAACWQAQMGMNPGTDPHQMKKDCTARWANQGLRKCELVEMQINNKSESDAKADCEKRLGGSS